MGQIKIKSSLYKNHLNGQIGIVTKQVKMPNYEK